MENDKSCRYILALDDFMKTLKMLLQSRCVYEASSISPNESERFGELAGNACDLLYEKFSTTCKEHDTTWTRYEFFNTFSMTVLDAISTCICNSIYFDRDNPHVAALHFFEGTSLKYIIKVCDEQPMIAVMHNDGKCYNVEYLLTAYSISKNILTVIGSAQYTNMQIISAKLVTL